MANPIVIPNNTLIIPVNLSSSFKTFTLPVVSTNPGRMLILKDMFGNAATSTLRLSTIGLDRIERSNVSSMVLSNAYGAWTFMNDGMTNWFLTNAYLNSLAIVQVTFNPNQISGLLVWTDASTLTLANNTAMTTWTNGGSQGTVNCTGTFLTNQLNGKGIVRFATTNTWTIASQPSLSAYTMAFVSRQRGGTNRRVLQAATSGNTLYGYWNGQKNVLYIEGDPGILSALPSDSNWDLFSHTRTQKGPYTWKYNGTMSYSSSSSFDTGLNGLAINTGAPAGVAETSDCDIAEILLYNSVLTTQQVQTLEGYLAWKWGLQGNLPANHPYKNAAP